MVLQHFILRQSDFKDTLFPHWIQWHLLNWIKLCIIYVCGLPMYIMYSWSVQWDKTLMLRHVSSCFDLQEALPSSSSSSSRSLRQTVIFPVWTQARADSLCRTAGTNRYCPLWLTDETPSQMCPWSDQKRAASAPRDLKCEEHLLEDV